ncbi:ribosome maturation protein RimP [Lactobacillus selangorensis]|uniref:Ribosome maturation factor RimP n=1 Tax=Lactobacillus selangorensis TaxID=81857 RepID=A0A0R2FPN7_9LACO|nr:ribosome maturation factor RimP [Lactobacillus selangorensis]KRN29606.1 ribosome maturation protein RimP [Lactobacillus selangorensis]KRN33864.1 ribosome maturation protein RimP [Lactobacillus selangorensis]
MSSSVVEIVRDLVTPIVEAHHLELVDVEYVKEGPSWFLRIYVDKPGGITIEECATVSDELSEKLDALDPDPIPQAYMLEVSSPGAERPLKKEADYEAAVDQYVHFSFYKAINGHKFYEGTLNEVTPDTVTLTIKDKTRRKQITIDRKQIAKARLAIEF